MSTLPQPSAAVLDEVLETRRDLHRHPELSFHEHRTSRLIRERLQGLGLAMEDSPTETGALARIDGGRPGRTVLLRADIDALPIHEETGLPFASEDQGRMHACGHDCHTAMMLGVARTLAERAEDLPGSYLFCFQPAEEIVSGARAMIEGGLFRERSADAALGLHIVSFLPSHQVMARAGVHWAGCDGFDIELRGPGGHGGLLKRQGNVVAAQSFILERLSTVVDGLEYEGVPCHTTVGDVRGDGAWNIVPREVHLRGSVRTFTPELRQEALQRLEDLLLETGTEFGIAATVTYPMSCIPVRNDERSTRTVLDVAAGVVGDLAQPLAQPLTVSDDMSLLLDLAGSGCYFMLGAAPADEDRMPAAHHTTTFRVDETAMEVGVRVLAGAGVRLAEPL
ncbi:MAG TPA: M20 family metallopeptidase [Candidatus Dormibacteraeota bacterium]|jgi:amidohydrolase|nr:M20 family metallopeptidase [Candidatus Dormibacteraeota bacterium]